MSDLQEPKKAGFYWLSTPNGTKMIYWPSPQMWAWSGIISIYHPTAIEPVQPPSWEKRASDPLSEIIEAANEAGVSVRPVDPDGTQG